jgi:hypothetical protein
MSRSSSSVKRSQSWFRPGVWVPVSNVRGLEVLSGSRGGVQVGRTVIHGTPAELRGLAAQLLRAATRVERREATAGP